MASKQMVHMIEGQGETSYARNCGIQNAEQKRMKPLIEGAILNLCGGSSSNTLLPPKIMVADLGCSSGPNAVALVTIAIETIHNHCLHFLLPPPEVCVLLNDLPNNDFNTMVKSLVMLHQSNNEPIVVTGVAPGSFYERLFTSGSLHLVCSSNSLHWLSKAPEVLERNQIPAYDIDEHARHKRFPMVLEAYAQQFRKDFTRFLKLRAKELRSRGQMVVSLIGRRSDGAVSKLFHIWDLVAQILSVMASEGVIDKERFNSFYIPMYGPSKEELRQLILEDGTFSIKDMMVHDFTSGVDSALMTPNKFSHQMTAVFGPIIVQHFGEVMDEFMRTAERCWSPDGSLQDILAKLAMLSISLTKA